jgi:hypothetical protein
MFAVPPRTHCFSQRPMPQPRSTWSLLSPAVAPSRPRMHRFHLVSLAIVSLPLARILANPQREVVAFRST